MDENDSLDGVMFLAGSQVTADGDMLPASFVIVSRYTDPETAIGMVAKKIIDDISGLDDIELHGATGQMEFHRIYTWKDFAELKIDDEVKTRALCSAITNEFLHMFCRSGADKAEELAAIPWV